LSFCSPGEDDVVVLATDGLWDVLSSQRVAHVIANSFVQSLGSQRQKFTLAAQEVVMQARGMQVNSSVRRMINI
jgi:protein phosphatase 1H